MNNQQDIQIKNEFMCPISLEWLEDPILTSCCGKCISRQSMIECYQKSHNCPLCGLDLDNYPDFDPHNVPKIGAIAYLVEEEKNKRGPIELFNNEEKKESKWKAKISCLRNNQSANETVIGRLEFYNTNNEQKFKTLLIPVIDKSGSMAGGPIRQVQYSLHRILDTTYNCPHITTHWVTYNDIGKNVRVDKIHNGIDYYKMLANELKGDGGTSFKSAFNEIVKICEEHKKDQEISSVVIIFLTDGEDSSASGVARTGLVETLKNSIASIWDRQYVVHTIGFGGQHDFDFLNNLRVVGTSEGAYRFADPAEDSDSLSNKINSLLEVVSVSPTIPLKITQNNDNVPILNGENDKYWINMTGIDQSESCKFTVSINSEQPIVIESEYAEDENDKQLWSKWYSVLIDDIASEILQLSAQPNINANIPLDQQIHFELLEQRSQAIMDLLDNAGPDYQRLQKLIDTLKIIKAGGVVDKLKLNDMKFEGKYLTKQGQSSAYLKPVIGYIGDAITTQIPSQIKKIMWDTINVAKYKRFIINENTLPVFKVIANFGRIDGCKWIEDNEDELIDKLDENKSNALIVASSTGKISMVEKLLESNCFDVNYCNAFGYNALDVAIIYGYWLTYDVLRKYGAKPSQDGQALLRTCISNRYFNVSKKLIDDGFAKVNDVMVDNAPSNEGYTWLSSRNNGKIDIETAIIKGIFDVVKEQLNEIKEISWKPYIEIFAKPTPEHVRIVDLLLEHKKAKAMEMVEIETSNDHSHQGPVYLSKTHVILPIKDDDKKDDEKVIIWPLFVACEKGQMAMFKVLMKYITKEDLNVQNHKGTTALWIASCNKHIDIVGDLISAGADPNIPNFKGDSALVPCCQKGCDAIVTLLLEEGAKLDVYNKNRDNPVLICCRTGQHKILEIFFKRMNPDELKKILEEMAEIDGFNPILASTEVDKVECIKMCHKYGANIEFKTSDINPIIAGATSLHLACHYGRLASAKTLCELGCNVKAQTIQGYTPLHIAIKQGHSFIVRYLLSLPQGKECLTIMDNNGHLPSFFASAQGNEAIYEEFFMDRLANKLVEILESGVEMEMKCAQLLTKYGYSLGCYGYDNITSTAIVHDGTPLLSLALLNNNTHMATTLLKMGADINKTDNYGITPAFWANYLEYKFDGFKMDNDNTMKMITRVKNMAKKSTQNKLLVNLQKGMPKLLESDTNNVEIQMEALIKMSDGFTARVKNDALTYLKNSQYMEHSLLGFLDKLKSNKVFPEGKECLEHMLWNTRVHLIKMIASSDQVLQPIHLMALYLYTGNMTIFKQVNMCLTNWKMNDIWIPFIGSLYQAITMLPKFQGEVYRAITHSFDSKDYTIGSKIKWSTFSICSQQWKNCTDLISQKKGMIFIIKSVTGRNISKYSMNPVDEEVIFLPETEFVIKNFYCPSVIALGQENIRTTTYLAKEKELLKATNCEASIMIELEECVSVNNNEIISV